MISYEPLWKTLKEKNISFYKLIHHHGMSSETINRLKHGKGINTKTTLNDLCKFLDCKVSDILEYIEEDENKQ